MKSKRIEIVKSFESPFLISHIIIFILTKFGNIFTRDLSGLKKKLCILKNYI